MGDAAYRKRHRDMGLCVSCPNPVDPGKTQCRRCLDKGNVRMEKLEKERLASGLCIRCDKPSVNGRFCVFHMARQANHSKRNYKNNKETYAKNRAKRREQLKQQNVCIDCLMPLTDDIRSGSRCINCRDNNGRVERGYYANHQTRIATQLQYTTLGG